MGTPSNSQGQSPAVEEEDMEAYVKGLLGGQNN
jgi:hypothetical protein